MLHCALLLLQLSCHMLHHEDWKIQQHSAYRTAVSVLMQLLKPYGTALQGLHTPGSAQDSGRNDQPHQVQPACLSAGCSC